MDKIRDVLTGFGNLAAFSNDLEDAARSEASVAIALIDMNNFKELNDTHGHEAGDRVLQTMAMILRAESPGDIYRKGGDEFAVIMHETSLEQAFLKMEKIRRLIQDSTERFAVPDGRVVTVGIGVAQYPRDAKDGEGLHRAASAALAYCKEIGSNQVILPLNEEMVMKSCYYSASTVRRLKLLAERTGKKESILFREALNDLLRKYDSPRD